MSARRRLLLDLALLAYPPDFRRVYRREILGDVEESNAPTMTAAFDIAASGLRMRLGLFANDVAYAARRLARMPLFVFIVSLTFALGIGANVAVFSVLNSVLLKPLPYSDPGRLVVFRYVNTKTSALAADLSVPEIADFGKQAGTLSDVGGVVRNQATLTGAGRPLALSGLDVTPPLFAALGVRPELGRFFTAADEAKGAHPIVISDRLWRSHFGAAADVVGRPIVLDGTSYQIVGVATADFKVPIPDEGRLVSPDYLDVQPDVAAPSTRGAQYIGTIARLRPGATIAAANAELKVISLRLQRLYPVEASLVYYVRPLEDAVLGDFRMALWTVFGAALGILIITCANVSNIVLSAASARDREFALRSALGASSRRLATQLLAETGLLATIGGVAGVALAYVSIALLRPALAGFPRADSISVDGSALAYALLVVVATTILAGFWPMRACARPDVAPVLNAAGRADSSASNPTRSALVVVEVSLALALVALTGLMLRSYYLMTQSDIGVRQDGLWVSSQISLPSSRFPALRDRTNFHDRFLAAAQSLPGVDSAALGLNYPLSGIHFGFDFGIVGRHFAPGSEPVAAMNAISPGYFDTMGIPLQRGRRFSANDRSESLPVAIVNETFERLYAPNGDAVGNDVNNHDHVVGSANVTGNCTGGGQVVAVMWVKRKIQRLGSLVPGGNSWANANNYKDMVVGASVAADGHVHGFFWRAGKMWDMGLLPGSTATVATDINANGDSVGDATIGSDTHAFFKGRKAKTMVDLGTLGGNNSSAIGIGRTDEVVGWSNTAGNDQHAFLYQSGTMKDLNDMIPSGTGWILTAATAMNDYGVISGYGTFGGNTHAFLLVPTR